MDQIAADAKQLLEDLDLFKVPVDPIEVCRKLGIDYDEQPYEGFDGTLLSVGESLLIGVSSKIKDAGRRAFTCGHELGHTVYDLKLNQSIRCTREDVGYGKGKLDSKEIRANEFSSELLLPKDFFLKDIRNQDPSWELMRKLVKGFGTSLQATTNRFVKLTHHNCWLVVVKDGAVQRFTKADHNDMFPIVKRTFKPPKTAPDGFRETMAESWFADTKRTKNKKILYWPMPENQYGESPVLLWDKSNSLFNDEFLGDDFDDQQSRRDDRSRGRWD